MKPHQFTFEMHSDLDLVASEVPTPDRVVELVVVPPSAGPAAARPSLNLALVIDRSGSMSGGKLANVRRAAEHVLDLLQEQDQVAIVAYDDTITLLAPSQPVSAQVRASLKSHLQELTPGNMTNLCGGWLSGCEEVARVARPAGGQLNRVLLLTDGLANVGITGLEEIGLHASQLLNKGIATSTFGVGLDFNEHLLEHMANQGGGRFYFIADPTSIPSIFVQEFRELAAVTAQAVEVTLQIPTQVDAKVLGSWRSEQNGQSLRLWLGDIPSGQTREVYVRLLIPPLGATPQAELLLPRAVPRPRRTRRSAGGFGAGYFQVRPAPAGSGRAGPPGGDAALQPGRDGRRGHRSAQAGARRQAPGSQPVDRAKPGGGGPVPATGRTGPIRAVVRAYFKARVGQKGRKTSHQEAYARKRRLE